MQTILHRQINVQACQREKGESWVLIFKIPSEGEEDGASKLYRLSCLREL